MTPDLQNNGHTHTHADMPIQTITIVFNPNTGQLEYQLQNITIADALQRLTLVQFFMFVDLRDITPTPNQEEVTNGD